MLMGKKLVILPSCVLSEKYFVEKKMHKTQQYIFPTTLTKNVCDKVSDVLQYKSE